MKNQAHALSRFMIALIYTLTLLSSSSSLRHLDQHQQNRVLHLPGQDFNITFSHFSGYISVDRNSTRSLFYWFFEAEEDPSSKPLVLWLNGGPGCSSIAYGQTEEIGPFHIRADGKTLFVNPFSWNKFANILFLDSPVGVGFSFSTISADFLNNGDSRTATDSLSFLLNWFDLFPQYKGREFYITGESYAGHYVPQLTHLILKHNRGKVKGKPTLPINLTGFMVGNALTDDYHDHLGVSQFLWSTGLISDQTYTKMNFFCDFQSFIRPSPACNQILDVADAEMGNIDPYSIFTPTCGIKEGSIQAHRTAWVRREGEKYDPCTEKHSVLYFNRIDVQNALHVNGGFSPRKWETCNDVVGYNWRDSSRSVLWIYREAIRMGVRVWMFSGDTDSVIPVTSTRYSIDSLKLQTVIPWRAWYVDDDGGGGEVGGWTEEYKGLTFVTVRGAGHEVPLHRPKLALILFKSFLSGESMPGLRSGTKDS